VPNTKDLDVLKDPFRVLIFGDYKTGKTWCSLTFPRPNVFDFDGGIVTVKNPQFVKQFGPRDVMYEQFPAKYDKRGVAANYDAWDNACRYFDACMKPAGSKWHGENVSPDMFDTWVIDSGTTASELAMAKGIILLGGKDAVKIFGQRSDTYSAAQDHGLVIPKIQDYGAERSQLEQLVQMVRDSGKMMVLLCHTKELRGKAPAPGSPGPIQAYVPLLTGRSVQSIPIMFDEVWCARTKPQGDQREFYLQTAPDGLRACGSRLGIKTGIPNNWGAIKGELDLITKQAPSAKEEK